MADKSDKTKNLLTAAKAVKSKRPSTLSVPSTSAQSNVRPKPKKNSTISADKEDGMPSINRQIAYGKFMRAMFLKCLVDEKIEREETQMEVQMVQLADRFLTEVEHLDKANRTLKDISFIVEQKSHLNQKKSDTSRLLECTEQSNAKDCLKTVAATEQTYLDCLHTVNVDFGYNKESGHKQLLDAVNEAIEGVEGIKKNSNLDMNKLAEFGKAKDSLECLEKDLLDLDSLKSDYEENFPKFTEKLLNEAAEKIKSRIQYEKK